ncbi:MAG: molybdopterin converting factor subunit 1 [Anaerolineales bacterium]|nr:molybdopterin converting factor subunit 1 [Anaerolineales bacterium]
MMNVKVLFFANLRERAGSRQVELDLAPDVTVAGLKKILLEKFPALKDYLPTVLVAVDREYAFDDTVLSDGAEVALFPPVSGG